jgi:GNAT superfamily N-acetyltransferase
MPPLTGISRVRQGDVLDLTGFLQAADLTVSGVDDPHLPLWIVRDADGRIEASTGFEIVDTHALIRSVAVAPSLRGEGLGLRLAQFALDRAHDAGARQAWLFSRRSGPFWRKLGFATTDRDELSTLLAGTHQVRAFLASGQLQREIAWARPLGTD